MCRFAEGAKRGMRGRFFVVFEWLVVVVVKDKRLWTGCYARRLSAASTRPSKMSIHRLE